MPKIFIFTLLFLLSACSSTKAEPNSKGTDKVGSEATPQASKLVGSWSHRHNHHSKDNAQSWVRKKELPPSRFRGKMIFEANGECKILVLHPADAHYYAQGTYVVQGNTLEIRYTVTHKGEQVTKRYEMQIAGDDMQLRELP